MAIGAEKYDEDWSGANISYDEERREKVIKDIWMVSDVIQHFNLKDEVVTEELAEQILWRMKKDYDANIGYNWDAVDMARINIRIERERERDGNKKY